MSLADDRDRIWVTTGPGVSAETPGAVAAVIRDPEGGDTEPVDPLSWWLERLPGAAAS